MSGIALAMSHTLIIHLRAQGLEEGDEHLWNMVDFTFTVQAVRSL